MAILEQTELTSEGETLKVAINFNPATLRLTNVTWDNPRNGQKSVRLQIWDANGDSIYTRAEGTQTGQRSFVGEHLVEEIPGYPGEYQLPSGWEWVADIV